jgi:catecholate siderophore receptor
VKTSTFAASAAAIALFWGGVAKAEGAEGEAAAADGEQQEIIVTGTRDGYRTIDTTSGTKTSTAILDVPQSISVVTAEQLNDQSIRSIAELVRLFPGISAGQGEGHRDQITLRGNNSTADFFVDGLRDDVQYFRSFYNVERVEAHKGPNATIFGRGGGGGIINRITKGAISGENLIAGSAGIDSFGAWSVESDVNVGLGTAGLRVNAFYEELNNHRDAFDGKRYGVNPVLGAEIGERIKLQLGYEYNRDSRVVDRGIPSAGVFGTPSVGTSANPIGPLRGFRDTFFGIDGVSETDFEAHVITFRSETELSDSLTLTTQSLYGDYDKVYSNVFPATTIGGTIAAPTLGIEAYRDPTTRKNLVSQANLQWKGNTGGIEHVVLLGAEYTRQKSTNQRVNGFFDSALPTGVTVNATRLRATIPFSATPIIPLPTFRTGAAFLTGSGNRATRSDLDQVSAYLQDQISFSDQFDLIVGLRYDRLDLTVSNVFPTVPVTTQRSDDLWSPRVGLVFKPVPQASVYASYTKSFLPQSGDQFLTLSATQATLKPEQFDNYEVGAKWDINPSLTATVAVYRLDRSNTTATVNNVTVQTGAQRSHGIEFGLTGRITPKWQTSIGYAITEAEITATTAAAPTGRRVAQVPRHQLSIWNRYDVTKRFGLGLGLYHQAKSFATISNITQLPAYTRLDAALFYKITDKIEAQVNVQNLTDATYFPAAHNDQNISTGAPINARFSITAKF